MKRVNITYSILHIFATFDCFSHTVNQG